MTALKERDTCVAFKRWYSTLATYKASGGPAKGTIAAGLVVLERLRQECSLRIEVHTARGGTQIRGVTGSAVRKILARFGEEREFSKEGGRTNRGLRDEIRTMLGCLQSAGLDELPTDSRMATLDALQSFLVKRLQVVPERRSLKLVFQRSRTTWRNIRDFLAATSTSNKHGPVAEYLVGAKLAIRFPEKDIRNKSYSTVDEQTGEPGDFLVGETAFHVTVAPSAGLYEKCKDNIRQGLRVYVLVPELLLERERRVAEATCSGRIAVESIESFVSQNIEEISGFSDEELGSSFRLLVDKYNERVDEVETDKSLLIEAPWHLK